jgi:hypothetical protein
MMMTQNFLTNFDKLAVWIIAWIVGSFQGGDRFVRGKSEKKPEKNLVFLPGLRRVFPD